MARISSLSILETPETQALLAEKYGAIIDNIQKNTISGVLKNKDLSGDPVAGTVEARRIANTQSAAYGTARSGGAGTKIKAPAVVVPLNINREIINEVEEKDIKTFGVNDFISRKTVSNQRTLERELERAFFAAAYSEGTEFTPEGTTALDKAEELIQSIETTKNEFVDGVDRALIHMVCKPNFYGQIRNKLDTDTNNASVTTATGEFGTYHGVMFHSSVYLPDGVDVIAMVEGSVAQPVLTTISNPEKIQLSDAYAFGIFFYYGTKAVTPDLIKYISTPEEEDNGET